MCRSERGPLAAKRHSCRSATKRSAEQNAESIRSQGVLSPLLVRPLTDQSFEIVAGARRYRAAKIAEAPTVPVRIVHLTDAEALEAQLVEIFKGKTSTRWRKLWAFALFSIWKNRNTPSSTSPHAPGRIRPTSPVV